MTTRTWFGSSSNKASDPNAWTPNGAPVNGDMLTMPTPGTMEIDGDALQTDPLTLGGGAGAPASGGNYTFLLNNGAATITTAPETSQNIGITVQGTDNTLVYSPTFPYGNNGEISLDPGAAVTGSLSQSFGNLTVTGQSGTVFHINGNNDLGGVTAQFDTAVDGSGTFRVTSAQGTSGKLEFTQSVGSGPQFIVNGDQGHYARGVIQIDNPSAFGASIQMGNWSEVDLVGLPSAISDTYDGSTLKLYDASGNVVDTLAVTLGPNPNSGGTTALDVSRTTSGVELSYGLTHGTDLPTYSPPPPAPTPTPTPAPTPPTPAPNPTPAPAPPPPTPAPTPATPPVNNTTTNNNTTVVNTSTNATSTSTANPVVTANDGTTPTPLSPSEVSTRQMVAGLNANAGAASTFFFEGQNLGTDYANLGAAPSSGQGVFGATTQTLTDMKQLLAAWVANPAIATGFSVPGGPTMAIPGQFVVDVVNAGLKADVIGSASLDQAYGGALTQFFAGEQQVMMGAGH